jgi:hypothetical protein
VVSASHNASSHTTQQFLAEKNIPVITQPPYSQDPLLFHALNMGLRGTGFTKMEGINSNETAELRKIPKESFRRCFQQWQGQ